MNENENKNYLTSLPSWSQSLLGSSNHPLSSPFPLFSPSHRGVVRAPHRTSSNSHPHTPSPHPHTWSASPLLPTRLSGESTVCCVGYGVLCVVLCCVVAFLFTLSPFISSKRMDVAVFVHVIPHLKKYPSEFNECVVNSMLCVVLCCVLAFLFTPSFYFL